MRPLSTYLDLITSACPELTVVTATVHTGDGQFNDILLVNDDLLFRFPRSAEVARNYATQRALLHYLQGKLPLPIPQPLYTSPINAPWESTFTGYRKLPGQPFYRGALANINEASRRRLAAQLGGFLRALHQLPLADLPVSLPVSDTPDDWRVLYTGFRETLFPHMRPDAQQWVADSFNDYFAHPHQFTFTPVLKHGDFGGSNILYDPDTNQITGIIDFESLGPGDPASDAAALSTYGDEFFELCLVAYPEMDSMRHRANFYRSTFALQEAYFGALLNDPEAFENGLAEYR